MKQILLSLVILFSGTSLWAQDTVLDDLPTNADGTMIRYVKKIEGGGTPDVAFDRIECLFKNTELLMKNYNAHGSEFSDSIKVVRIKIKENIETPAGTKQVVYWWGIKCTDKGLAMKATDIKFLPRCPIESLDHEDEKVRDKARSYLTQSRDAAIIKEYIAGTEKLINERFDTFSDIFMTSKKCKAALKDEDDW